MWGEHLDIARAISCIAEHDTSKATVFLAKAMTLLQRDLIVNCTDIARTAPKIRQKALR
ncbi:hypothetical protein MITS9509_01351 [Synechococcus sp. MIT S9509]|uniref:hypothetical protein n=1 Tax=Synechococcus sp. MIT S9509 TaxID=1801630 RepID=UPI0007BB8201|nr:hypothetical protein [Synechococcus sp. MIT S9509]KZR92364.1 hypothetical protein MITS9509_01351 [Synechococcus sp. MIT S9509]